MTRHHHHHHHHPSGSWLERNARYVLLGLVAVAAVSLVALAISFRATPASHAHAESLPLPSSTTATVVTVSILSDSHAFNADSWWRQTVVAGTVPGVVLGAFESQPGADTATLVARIEAAAAKGGLVIVQAGTNDLLSAKTPAQALVGIEALWQGISDHGATPIAALVPPSKTRSSGVVTLNTLITNSASSHGLKLLDVYSAVASPDGNWADGMSGDGTHANREGSDIMAKAARDQLRNLIAP